MHLAKEPEVAELLGIPATVTQAALFPVAYTIGTDFKPAYNYAERIAANAPLAVFATKQSAVEGLALDLESAYNNETRHSDRVFDTEDAKEGPRAFAEKRPPQWQAR